MPNTRKTPKITTGKTPDTRKSPKITTGISANTGVKNKGKKVPYL
jgi:hypothetical protein